jgi:two-component system, NarL family, response regulator
MSGHPIRVLVADDHLVVRFGLTSIIDGQEDMEVVGQASTGVEVIDLYRMHRPDVTLMDLRMPGKSGDEAIADICQEDPKARVIVLTIHRGDEAVHRAIRAGARGYLLKDVPFQDLLAAIRAVHEGKRCIPAELAGAMAGRLRHEELTPREVDVLKLIAGGLTNKLAGERLDITENAVKHHVAAILSKLDAQDRTHAVMLALDRGIIHLEDVDLHS